MTKNEMVFQYLVDKDANFWDISEFEQNQNTEINYSMHLNRDLLR